MFLNENLLKAVHVLFHENTAFELTIIDDKDKCMGWLNSTTIGNFFNIFLHIN